MSTYSLPSGIDIFERGWLSANSILLHGEHDVSLVDTGYCAHHQMTVDLVSKALDSHQQSSLHKIVNTHLHSDHCGGNAALLQKFGSAIYVPQAQYAAVNDWNESLLSFQALGQECPRFVAQETLIPGQVITLGQYEWNILAAPGHDPHSIMLYQPDHQILISADALWERGFGVVFPELWGEGGFEEVMQTLQLIERLPIALVIPGHGKPFVDVAGALDNAKSRLTYLSGDPKRNAQHGAKVLLKYKLLEWRKKDLCLVEDWIRETPILSACAHYLGMNLDELMVWLPRALVSAGAAQIVQGQLVNVD